MPQVPPSVRLALPSEAAAIARVQRAAWAADHTPELAAWFAAEVPTEMAAAMWEESIRHPGLATNRVLVAVANSEVVGFAATSAAGDPDRTPADGEVVELAVDPAHRREGHGSRLLHAAADTLVADGFGTAGIWVPATFDGLRAFLTGQGFGVDGAHQEARSDTGMALKLVRLVTQLT